MLIGYMRPNQEDQHCDIQKEKLATLPCNKIFTEEHTSAKERVQLKAMLNNLNQGDTIVIEKLFTLADSTRHLAEVLHLIETKGAYLYSIKEGIDTSQEDKYPFGEIVHYLLEFQGDVISENTKRGLYKAKQKGARPGRPRKPDQNVQRAIIMYESKQYSLAEIKNETGISKSTLYRYLER